MPATPTTSPKTASLDKGLIAQDFITQVKGRMPQSDIDAIVSSLKATATAYSATGSVASMIFYLRFTVDVKDGKHFTGDAGGVSTPGGGALIGDVYTDSLENLYAKTVSFEFNATSVYTSLLFFDSSSHLLGHFQAGAVSTVNGVGGGKGSWT
jgi:hypothetical protein